MAHPFIQHLERDHEEQRKLGQKLKEAKGAEERERLRQQFHEALLPHVEGEEASIFDYMQNAGGKAREEALKALQEHHVAEVVLRELMELSLEGDVFSAKAYVLDELNRHHMEEEETTHFPMLEEMASDAKIDELFEQYKETEKAVEKK
jgi:hemerythrin-like domain-containing protein